MRYCGREFLPKEILWINRLIAEDPGVTRQELSRRFCRKVNWRKPDGGLKDMSCRVAFLKMDKNGVITLPAPKRAYAKPGTHTKRTPLCKLQSKIVQPAGGLKPEFELVKKEQSAL